MREIKFRAWDEILNKMIQHSEIDLPVKSIKDGRVAYFSAGFGVAITGTLILMQYTGLKDKNGVEIYEGDIIINPQGKKFYIGECCGGLSLISVFHYGENYNDLIADPINDLQNASYIQESGEVIGNIYQNPELLTKGGIYDNNR